MTRREAVRAWANEVLPLIQRAYETERIDWVARRESWGVFVDGLCKEGRVSLKQYESWSLPAACKSSAK